MSLPPSLFTYTFPEQCDPGEISTYYRLVLCCESEKMDEKCLDCWEHRKCFLNSLCYASSVGSNHPLLPSSTGGLLRQGVRSTCRLLILLQELTCRSPVSHVLAWRSISCCYFKLLGWMKKIRKMIDPSYHCVCHRRNHSLCSQPSTTPARLMMVSLVGHLLWARHCACDCSATF